MKSATIWTITIIIIIVVIAGALIFMFSYNNVMKNSGALTNNPSSSNNPSTSQQSTQSSSNQQQNTATPKIHQVSISNFAFSSSSLTIKKGDTVIWTNMDSTSHTVTSDTGSELDSSSLSKGATYSHTFNTAGTYDYHCSIHMSMKASITVQ